MKQRKNLPCKQAQYQIYGMRKIFFWGILILGVTFPVGDLFSQSAEAISSDTLILPPPNESYQVVGMLPGLEGYLVWYDDILLRGGNVINSEGMDALQEQDTRLIISITPNELLANLSGVYGIDFMELEFDYSSGLSTELLNSFLALMSSPPGVVYVHSTDGNTYAGLLGLAYRIYLQNWEPDKAMIEYARLGGSLKDAHRLVEQVLHYKP